MSYPLSKFMTLNEEKKNKKMAEQKEYPMRYKKLNLLAPMTDNNHQYELSDFDQFNIAMRQNKKNRGMENLHLVIKRKTKPFDFSETESWIDPAQRRRAIDPDKAPVFDYNAGSAYEKFTTNANQRLSHSNVGLIQKAHESYYNYVNRYNMRPGPPSEGKIIGLPPSLAQVETSHPESFKVINPTPPPGAAPPGAITYSAPLPPNNDGTVIPPSAPPRGRFRAIAPTESDLPAPYEP